MGNGSEPQGLDPHIVTGVPEHHIIQALFEGLTLKDKVSLEVKPGAAESWVVSDDGLVYEFTLRENAKWSNGDPVTAHDFEWSWWRALQPKLGSQYVFMLFPIKNAERYFKQEVTDFSQVGVKALDDRTLRVELANPTPYFLHLLDHYSMFPVHRATIEKFGEPDQSYTRWTRPKNIVTNGPFILKEWRLNKHVFVTRNEQYWGNKDVKLNGIKFYPIELTTTEDRMFRAGQLHFTEEVPTERIPHYKKTAPEKLTVHPYLGSYFYRVNTSRPHLADVRVRKALAFSIDRDAIAKSVMKETVTPSYAMTPPGLLGYQPPKLFEYDIEKARQLLAEAGYPNGEGFPTTELQYNTNEDHRKIAIAIQQMWKTALNIDVTLQNKDWKVYLDDETTGNYDISRAGWIADYPDPNSFLDMWMTDGGVNRTRWGNPRYDELVLQMAPKAKTQDERFAHFFEAESILFENMPVIPIYIYTKKHLLQPSMKGMVPNLMDYHDFRQIELQASPNKGETH